MEKITPDQDLFDYLDGVLNESQAKYLEEKIEASSALRARLEELRSIHATLNTGAQLEIPSTNFTQRVMSRLDAMPVSSSFSPKNGLLLLTGILIAVGVGLVLLQSGIFDSVNGRITLDAIPIKKEWLKNPLPSIPLNGKLFVNSLLIVATGLSLVLLDRTILRPLFQRRSEIF